MYAMYTTMADEIMTQIWQAVNPYHTYIMYNLVIYMSNVTHIDISHVHTI